VEIWDEVLRVLKPGAHALIACGTRTQRRMAVNIEDAGFEIRDVICWHYGSGFPKSLDISKAIDKLNGRGWLFQPFAMHYEEMRKSAGLSHKAVCEQGKFYGDHNHGGSSSNWSAGNGVPTLAQWEVLQPLLNLNIDFLPLIERVEAERNLIGSKNGSEYLFAPGIEKERKKTDILLTRPATEAAKQWDGWGTALKPATEFWTLVRKPLEENTIAANVLKYGTGGMNIDTCRVPFHSEEDFNSATYGTGTNIMGGNYAGGNHIIDSDRKNLQANPYGRFPANVILDDFMAAEMDRRSGELSSGKPYGISSNIQRNACGEFAVGIPAGYGDSGGASRFFYCAKPSPEERGAYNNHATVKPLALMQYLIKLICPMEPERIVLDPYAGSGTTLIAARQLGVNYIAYEMESAHIPIIEQRLKDHLGIFQ
jgi:hypothetical protein